MAAAGPPGRVAVNAVTIERIAAGGDGVGRLDDGLTVFVPRTAPGDVVEIAITERKRSFARAEVREWVTRGPARVEAGCRHYVAQRCGGCQLQHLSASEQLEVKRRIVGDALRRIGKREVADPPIVPSPEVWHYRRKITLAASGAAIGLHPYDAPGRVFELTDCPITTPRLMNLWRTLQAHRGLLPAPLKALVLREDRSGGLHVVVEAGADAPWDAAPLARAVDASNVTYWWRPGRGAVRVVHGVHTGFPPLAFEQVNPEFGARIRGDAVAALGEVASQTVWDLYAGVGDAAAMLARAGADVWAVEMERSAVEWGRQAHGGGVHWVTGRVEESLHRLSEPQAVIANPPRGGMHRQVTARLQRWATEGSPRRLAYVSCDPATLARDLVRMPALAIVGLTAYDLFPQTAHVETLAVLEAA